MGAVTKVGLTPTVSFSAPTQGAPDHDTVTVRTLEDVLDGDGTVLSEATSVQLPAGLLAAGSYDYFQVSADVGTRLAAPRRACSHTAAGARTATGIVTP